jgi:hypothetical protein
MAILQTLWKMSNGIVEIKESKLNLEKELEEALETNIEILNKSWLIIGRQVITNFGKYMDLLAIDANGSIIILELKRDKTPRDVIAQALEYASYINTLNSADVIEIYNNYNEKYLKNNLSLDQAFQTKFKTKLDEENINNSHKIIVVATELDSGTERIISYLDNSNIPLYIVFFKIFEINNEKYINQAWIKDPNEEIGNSSKNDEKEPWNGEYYVSYNRDWNDAVKYGFISGGGGAWYSRTLSLLNKNDRVWVKNPEFGYLGVGLVEDTMHKAKDVIFENDGKKDNIYNLPHEGDYNETNMNDDDMAEYIVKIKWIKTVDIKKAFTEVGFFGNQNTVCRPTSKKWNHTIERLKNVWGIS